MNAALLHEAVDHHRAGRLDEAEAIYRRLLDRLPDHADLLHLLGVVRHQRGDHAAAAALIRRAIAADGANADYHSNLGEALRALGRGEEALASFGSALALRPGDPELTVNLGNALLDLGRHEEAAARYRAALRLRADLPAAHYNLGNALKAGGDAAAALESYRAALSCGPPHPDLLNHLGHAYQLLERHDEAIAHYRQAIAAAPSAAPAHNNLGNALQDIGDFDGALEAYRRAVALDPAYAEGWDNIGNAFQDRGMIDDALAAYDRALAIRPDDADIRLNRANALLVGSDLSRGFAEYECRWRASKFPAPRRDFREPAWDGAPRDGTVLLHAEQGLGDSLQFLRFVPEAAKRARIVLECQPPLVRLVQAMAGPAQVVATGTAVPFDAHLPLMSLPHVLNAEPRTGPAPPYLQTPPAAREDWARKDWRVAGAKRHVGIVWTGNPRNRPGRLRSVPFSRFLPILRQPNIAFYSLQLGDSARDLAQLPPGIVLRDLGPDIGDFADSAAILDGLDLLITVDTAAAHLAGALGRPVWTLLTFAADWRWFLKRADSPWYPTMRLFRQPRPNDWDAVVAAVASALAAL